MSTQKRESVRPGPLTVNTVELPQKSTSAHLWVGPANNGFKIGPSVDNCLPFAWFVLVKAVKVAEYL